MRFISVATVCVLAASSHVFAVPLGQNAQLYVSRRDNGAGLVSGGGASLSSGIGAAISSASGALQAIFDSNGAASRRNVEDLERLFNTRGPETPYVPRQDSAVDQSGSLSLASIAQKIGSILTGISSRSDSQRRDLDMYTARRAATSVPKSGSTLENVASGLSIASAATNILHDIFEGSGNNTKREAVTSADESGAIDPVSLLKPLLGLRELADADNESAALNLGGLKLGGLANSGLQALQSLIDRTSNSAQRREVIEQLLRRGTDSSDTSGAIAIGNLFKTLGNIGSIAINGGGLLADPVGSAPSGNTQARELVEHVARSATQDTDDSSEAISLQDIVYKIGSILLGGPTLNSA